MKIKIVATTDIGKERTNNEDAYIICPDLLQQDWSLNGTPSYIPLNSYGSVIVVADGMGGANAGEVASTIATNSIKKTFSKDNIKRYLDSHDVNGLLELCIKKADEAINKRILEDPNTSGMGTTIIVCWIINKFAHIAWCGDSRCYVYNPCKGIKQLTKDHSLVQGLVDKGEITEKEAFVHPDNNVITQGLGDFDSQTTPDIISYSLSSNDTLLLCSDGLCGYCTNKKIKKTMWSNYIDVMRCRNELLKDALNAGGYDNICIVLASIISDDQNLPDAITVTQKLLFNLKNMFNRIY